MSKNNGHDNYRDFIEQLCIGHQGIKTLILTWLISRTLGLQKMIYERNI